MKQVLVLLIAMPLLFMSCKKEDKCPYTDSAASASTTERDFLRANSSATAIEHPSGVFYEITSPGSGNAPGLCSTVTVRYTGTLIPTGARFDGTDVGEPGRNFTLGELLLGWKKVLPLLKAGGKMTLYIPPSLGYGDKDRVNNQQQVIIPANSYLKFVIDLDNVQ
ncbi:MAG: FKBP-type peptidyl-prolyl cis-trans isomerase [Gloeobacteraceae cyanobacterium ES-bin-316]|nr:FKBP-type peptidyl-prolyl cis-trans isomerase [Ferruginibacter sp.]